MTDILAPRTDFKAFVSHDVLSGGDRIEVLVRGARCGGCMSKIEKAVTALPGVESARLNLTTGKLVASCAAGRADPARLVACVEALGYGASLFDPARALEAGAPVKKHAGAVKGHQLDVVEPVRHGLTVAKMVDGVHGRARRPVRPLARRQKQASRPDLAI